MKLKIETKQDIINILDYLKPYEKNYISQLEEDSLEYELACERVQDYLLEIEEALIGAEQYNFANIVNADIRMFTYWDYIKDKISVKKLFKKIKEHSSKDLLINVD